MASAAGPPAGRAAAAASRRRCSEKLRLQPGRHPSQMIMLADKAAATAKTERPVCNTQVRHNIRRPALRVFLPSPSPSPCPWQRPEHPAPGHQSCPCSMLHASWRRTPRRQSLPHRWTRPASCQSSAQRARPSAASASPAAARSRTRTRMRGCWAQSLGSPSPRRRNSPSTSRSARPPGLRRAAPLATHRRTSPGSAASRRHEPSLPRSRPC
mmetsp:Transcript_125880/g.402967  ORF Transcript_125880/g.402967 Transcript_125880/m.402967 type:complete len:212 (+) Transcript_125880:302-937(+)